MAAEMTEVAEPLPPHYNELCRRVGATVILAQLVESSLAQWLVLHLRLEEEVAAAKAEAARVAEAAKAEAEKAAEAAKAEAAKAADNAKTQALIDNARSLVIEGKFSEAASVLQQLAGQTLSGDQTKLVESLKEQIQKALAAKATENAAGSVGNLLKK